MSLIAAGADINDTLVNGRTPLMVAVEFENDLTVKYLLTKPGLHVNATDADGNTALIIAAELNEYGNEMARMLLQKKADPNSENRKKKSPLTIACKAQNMELVHMLLDNQVYMCCRKYREPLHKCICMCAVIIGPTKRICICPSAGRGVGAAAPATAAGGERGERDWDEIYSAAEFTVICAGRVRSSEN